jgi:hypothetical protein
MRLAIPAGLIVGFVGWGHLAAGPLSYSFTSIDVPGALETRINGINNAGQIVGSYQDALGVFEGFLYSDGIFATINASGFAGDTSLNSINNRGQIVGSAGGHGFLDSNGTFTFFDAPQSTAASEASAFGINDSGQIVGSCFNCSGVIDGFLYINGMATAISVPGASETQIYGINNAGQIVGSVLDNGQFGLLDSNGVFTLIDIPEVQLLGINDQGQIVGNDFADLNGIVDGNGIFVSIDYSE